MATSTDKLERLQRFAGPLAALCALAVYTRTLAPSLGGTIDSAEFQQATYSLAIVHPTGYPLYLLIGRLWITIFPFGDPAFRVNLLSAVFAALAVWVLYATVRQLTGSMVAAVGASVLFIVQAIPWAQAGVAEINSLNTLLTGLAFLTVVLWSGGKLPIAIPALAYSLAASHHRTALLYGPLLLLYSLVALKWGTPRHRTRSHALLALALLLAPFLAYAYIPLRAGTTSWYDNSWSGFWAEVLGESALPVIGGALGRPVLPRFRSLLTGQVFGGLTGYVLLGLGVIGTVVAVVYLLRRRNASQMESHQFNEGRLGTLAILLYAAAFVLGVSFATLYDILDIGDYLAVPIFMWCVLAGVGLAYISGLGAALAVRYVRWSFTPTAIEGIVLIAVLVLAGFTASRSLHRQDLVVDHSGFDRRAYWEQVKSQDAQLAHNAILVCDWPEAHEAQYLQQAEGWRPDLDVEIVDGLLSGDGQQIDRWLNDKRPVFLLGEQATILSRYSARRDGVLWVLTGRQAEQATPPMAHALNWRYGSNIVLLGYTLQPDPPVVSAGALLNLTLYWKATERVSERYVVFNHVIDAQGGKVGQSDGEPGRGFKPTVYWTPGEVITDSYPIAINAGAAPGSYRLMSGLYTRLGEQRLQAFGADGAPIGDYPQIASIVVK